MEKGYKRSIVIGFCVMLALTTAVPGEESSRILTPALTESERTSASQFNNIFRRAVQQAMPAVVFVKVAKTDGNHRSMVNGLGSGCIIDSRGYVVTNDHVVKDTDWVGIVLADGREFVASEVYTDQYTDLAVVKIDPCDEILPVASFGDSNKVEVGDFVMAIGSPFGLEQTVTAGIVSFLGRQTGILSRQVGYEDFIQTDADINRGNSGGPLINLFGEVIGINSNIFSPTGVSTGYGFAVPSNLTKFVVEQLIEHGQVHRGWLGITQMELDRVRSINENELQSFPELWQLVHNDNILEGMPDDLKGIMIVKVVPGDPAEKAGLRGGDVVVSIDGKKMENSKKLRAFVATLKPDSQVECVVWRDGQETTFVVTLAERTDARVRGGLESFGRDGWGNDGKGQGMPGSPGLGKRRLGAVVRTLTPSISLALGYSTNTRGVLIEQVKPGSIADTFGLKQGNVIVSVNGNKIRHKDQLAEALMQADWFKRGIKLGVLNESGTREVTIQQKD